jgi:hypothetical protein
VWSKILTLKDAGVVQKCPVVRRLFVISLKVMLWSQKFLTLPKTSQLEGSKVIFSLS